MPLHQHSVYWTGWNHSLISEKIKQTHLTFCIQACSTEIQNDFESCKWDPLYYIGFDVRNPVFGDLRKTKAQTSLRIRTDWSATLLNFNFLASLCSWGDWFESPFVGNPEDRFCRDEAHIMDYQYHNLILGKQNTDVYRFKQGSKPFKTDND